MRAGFNVPREEVLALLKVFEEAGKAFYYKEYIIIPKWLKHQKIMERSDVFLGALKILRTLPEEIKGFIRDRRHYDFDVTPYIGVGEPHARTTRSGRFSGAAGCSCARRERFRPARKWRLSYEP
jgi:hypothetical protein